MGFQPLPRMPPPCGDRIARGRWGLLVDDGVQRSPQGSMRRPDVAFTTASVRVDTFNLRQAFSIWKLTVRLLMLTICAISGEVLPRADHVRHSSSRSFKAKWRDHTSLRADFPKRASMIEARISKSTGLVT